MIQSHAKRKKNRDGARKKFDRRKHDMDLWDIYADYINGKREIAEINAQMTGTFYTEEDLNH